MRPENAYFFKKYEFFSELKKAVSRAKYEDAKFLYKAIKMRNWLDMNDLFNVQDVVWLCEIFENRA